MLSCSYPYWRSYRKFYDPLLPNQVLEIQNSFRKSVSTITIFGVEDSSQMTSTARKIPSPRSFAQLGNIQEAAEEKGSSSNRQPNVVRISGISFTLFNQASFEKLASGNYTFGSQIIGNSSIIAVKDGAENESLVVKRTSKRLEPAATREVSALSKLCHPNIITGYGWGQDENNVYLLLEKGRLDLFDLILTKSGHFSEKEIYVYFRQILDAVIYLHEKNYIHRDIKCENILGFSKGVLKLIDFGFSKMVGYQPKNHTPRGTKMYGAPEVLLGMPYNFQSDHWGLGMVLYCLTYKGLPFNVNGWRRGNQIPLQGKSPDALIKKLLEVDTAKRLGGGVDCCKAILSDPWMIKCSEKYENNNQN